MEYLIFEANKGTITRKQQSSLLWNILGGFLSIILPKANPDYDKLIGLVKNWIVEFNNDGIPNREVGINEFGIVILKMPHKKNYGFWIDNNLTLENFKQLFDAKSVDAEYFQKMWNSLT